MLICYYLLKAYTSNANTPSNFFIFITACEIKCPQGGGNATKIEINPKT